MDFSNEEIRKINFDSLDNYDKFLSLHNFYKELNNKYGCDSFDTTYIVTKLIEYHANIIDETLLALLCNYIASTNNTKEEECIAFLAFYSLAIILYRQNEVDKLKNHVLKFEKYFCKDFPLFYDTVLRFYIIKHDYKSQLRASDKIAEMKKLAGCYEMNVGDKNSYMVAVTGILEYYCLYGAPKPTSNKKVVKSLDKEMSKKKIDYYYSPNTLNKMINIASKYSDEVIKERKEYARYYSYRAKFLFFKSLYKDRMLKSTIKEEIINLLDKALSITEDNAQSGIGLRDLFEVYKDFIESFPEDDENWKNDKNYGQMKLKSEISLSKSMASSSKPENYDGISNYAFISYSSKDYKVVYSDLVEFNAKGIVYNYDSSMIPELNKNAKAYQVEEWYKIVEEKIRNCTVAICYLSENFISSDAVIKELCFIKKYDKPIICIDLSGLSTTGRIIKKYLKFSSNELSTDKLLTISQVLNDNVSNVVRGNKAETTTHINYVYNWIDKQYSGIIKNVNSESIVRIGNSHKVCEDYALINDELHLFIVSDGVTRTIKEYDNNNFLARDVSEIFSNKVYQYFEEHYKDIGRRPDDIMELIISSILEADKEVKKYNEKNKDKIMSIEAPGCCFVMGLVYNSRLYYAGVGDSTILLIRNNQVIKLFHEQTDYAFNLLKISKERDVLVKEYINNMDNSFGYGLANGDLKKEFIQNSIFDLNFGDVLLFTSDGASKFLGLVKPLEFLRDSNLEDIVEQSDWFDKKFSNNEIDDKAIIRVKIGKNTDKKDSINY